MKGGAWLVLAVSMLMGLGLTIGGDRLTQADAHRRRGGAVSGRHRHRACRCGAEHRYRHFVSAQNQTENTADQPVCGVFVSGAYSLPGCGFATRKIMRGVSVLAFVFGAMDSVMNELPPMTEFAPMTVLPPRMDAPE